MTMQAKYVFVLIAEHPTVPGQQILVYATRAAAERQATDFARMFLDTLPGTHSASSWERMQEIVEEYHGAQYTRLEILEREIQRPVDPSVPEPFAHPSRVEQLARDQQRALEPYERSEG